MLLHDSAAMGCIAEMSKRHMRRDIPRRRCEATRDWNQSRDCNRKLAREELKLSIATSYSLVAHASSTQSAFCMARLVYKSRCNSKCIARKPPSVHRALAEPSAAREHGSTALFVFDFAEYASRLEVIIFCEFLLRALARFSQEGEPHPMLAIVPARCRTPASTADEEAEEGYALPRVDEDWWLGDETELVLEVAHARVDEALVVALVVQEYQDVIHISDIALDAQHFFRIVVEEGEIEVSEVLARKIAYGNTISPLGVIRIDDVIKEIKQLRLGKARREQVHEALVRDAVKVFAHIEFDTIGIALHKVIGSIHRSLGALACPTGVAVIYLKFFELVVANVHKGVLQYAKGKSRGTNDALFGVEDHKAPIGAEVEVPRPELFL